MKIILAGATGVVGIECVRIALLHPDITEVIALGRRPVSVPPTVNSEKDKSKLKNAIVEDMGSEYPEDVKEQLRGADACIWNLAITPSKAKKMSPEEVKKICHDYTLIGLRAMLSVSKPDRPFRFIYTSGAMTERDQNRKDLWLIADYRRMRGAVESAVLSEATNSNGRLEVQVQKPGWIDHSQRSTFERMAMPVAALAGLPGLEVSEVAASELDQAMNGFGGKDTLEVPDMVKVGQQALKKWDIADERTMTLRDAGFI